MPLTDLKVRTAKPQAKPYKLADEKGLYLLVNPNGSKYWRLKYRYLGKEKSLALGVYDEVTLAQARNKRDEARKMLADDIVKRARTAPRSLTLCLIVKDPA